MHARRCSAVVCTVALNAASQPEYARRHAIKICAYREFLEPLQETHAGEDGDYKASKVSIIIAHGAVWCMHEYCSCDVALNLSCMVWLSFCPL